MEELGSSYLLVPLIMFSLKMFHSSTIQGMEPNKYQKAVLWAGLEIFSPLALRGTRGEKISSLTHKTGSWYLLGIRFKVSDEHPGGRLTLLKRTPPPSGPMPVFKTELHFRWWHYKLYHNNFNLLLITKHFLSYFSLSFTKFNYIPINK